MATKEIIICDGCGFETKKAACTEKFYYITFSRNRFDQEQNTEATGDRDLCQHCFDETIKFLDELKEQK